MPSPFHLAIPVHDLSLAREFYGNTLACPEGRSSNQWIDFNLFGHQLVCHLSDQAVRPKAANAVDGHEVPIPHFGVVLEMEQWQELKQQLEKRNIKFVVEPHIRFKGQAGEQATMFFQDPSGNALEFKAFRDIEGELFRQ